MSSIMMSTGSGMEGGKQLACSLQAFHLLPPLKRQGGGWKIAARLVYTGDPYIHPGAWIKEASCPSAALRH